MTFLGAYDVTEDLIFRVRWTVDPSQPTITATSVTFRHASEGTTIGPLAATFDSDLGAWAVQTQLPSGGRWNIVWQTTPPGGVAQASIYVQ